jgi:hypothetical protein
MRNNAVTQIQYVYGLFEQTLISLNSPIELWDIEINECYAASETRHNIWFMFHVLQMFGPILKQEVLYNVTFCRPCLFVYGLFDEAVNTIMPYLHKCTFHIELNFSFFSE